jgi:hypothetical protein
VASCLGCIGGTTIGGADFGLFAPVFLAIQIAAVGPPMHHVDLTAIADAPMVFAP